MTQLVWDAAGSRIYQFGVDRGVLYPDTDDGVAWNGLIAVTEATDGGDINSYYIDGMKYLAKPSSEDSEFTLEAFTYPDEFGVCEGTNPIEHGLFITKQRRRPFGLAYRTRVGSDIGGPSLGYKIHLVYGAKVAPSDRANTSFGAKADPLNFSWTITTVPPEIDGHRPTSHFVIDSLTTPDDLLEFIEDILYGTDDDDPRLPVVDELVFLFEIYDTDVYDAGGVDEVHYLILDGGNPPSTPQPNTVDGGGP